MATKFNAKKFFKGTNVFGYGDSKYSYAVAESGYAAIRMLRDSKIRDAIAKDIVFKDFDEEMSREKIKATMDKVFDPDKKWIEAKRLRLDLEIFNGSLYLYSSIENKNICKGFKVSG